MTDHRLLTVRQPWAKPIVDGVKNPENRGPRFGTGYRGPLWIHAGATWDDDGLRSEIIAEHYLAPRTLFDNYHDAGFVLGAVIGLVIVTDAHHGEPGCCHGSPWADRTPGATHLVLAHPYPVRGPVVPGALGIWRADRVPGLADDLDRLLAGLHRTEARGGEEFGEAVSVWPDLCSHPSSSGGRCDACRTEVAPC